MLIKIPLVGHKYISILVSFLSSYYLTAAKQSAHFLTEMVVQFPLDHIQEEIMSLVSFQYSSSLNHSVTPPLFPVLHSGTIDNPSSFSTV